MKKELKLNLDDKVQNYIFYALITFIVIETILYELLHINLGKSINMALVILLLLLLTAIPGYPLYKLIFKKEIIPFPSLIQILSIEKLTPNSTNQNKLMISFIVFYGFFFLLLFGLTLLIILSEHNIYLF